VKRFWSKVAIDNVHSCWEWQAYLHPKGYGQFRLDGRMHFAHRIAYFLVRGECPINLELDHLCRNRKCVNPFHLEAVTHKENCRRGALVKSHCSKGHSRSPETTTRSGNCKPCKNEQQRELYKTETYREWRREYNRQYRQRPEVKQKAAAYARKWRARTKV
jgi:hypothetical protein